MIFGFQTLPPSKFQVKRKMLVHGGDSKLAD